jgi:hypothetical protein
MVRWFQAREQQEVVCMWVITVTFLLAVFAFGGLVAVLIRDEELDLDDGTFDRRRKHHQRLPLLMPVAEYNRPQTPDPPVRI